MTEPNAPQLPEDGSKHLGQPVWRTKESPKWPLWAVLGILIIAVVWFFMGGPNPPQSTRPPKPAPGDTTVTAPKPGGPVDLLALMRSGVYRLSADTLMAAEAGGAFDATAAGVTKLPADSQIGVMESQMMDGVAWYRVQATDANGKEIGRGWVSSASLMGQDLKLLK